MEQICMMAPCPKCDKGHLLPFSFKTDIFEFWKCSNCGYKVLKKQE